MTAVAEKVQHLEQGHHSCFFYSDSEQQVAATVPYLQAGLRKNERCIFLGTPASVRAVESALVGAGTDVVSEVIRGSLILSSDRPYLTDGRFVSREIIGFLDQAIEDALAAGFTGLRATGDVLWELGNKTPVDVLVQYELELDKFFYGKKLTGMCQYGWHSGLAQQYNPIAYAHTVQLNAPAF